VLYTIHVSLKNVLDLTAPGLLDRLGITPAILQGDDHSPCQQDLSTSDFEVLVEEVIAADERT
jgi:hypothetical protein